MQAQRVKISGFNEGDNGLLVRYTLLPIKNEVQLF